MTDYWYDVALSFAGEDRTLVDALALALSKRNIRMFYDVYEDENLWGKDLAEVLHEVYAKKARYCLMIVSKSYLEKWWPRHERRSAFERQVKSDEEYILPIRLDDTELPGLPGTIKYVRMTENNIEEIADMVVKKLGRTSSSPDSPVPTTAITPASVPPSEGTNRLLARHSRITRKMFPAAVADPCYSIHTAPTAKIEVAQERLDSTFLSDKSYSEIFNYSNAPTTHPDGYTRSYSVRADGDARLVVDAITCYRDGQLVTEGMIDEFHEQRPYLNPNWFIYEIQRHLELAREILEGSADAVDLLLHFDNIEDLGWAVFRSGQIWSIQEYCGYHHDIGMRVALADIHQRGDQWNLKMEAAVAALEQVARMFGLDHLPQPYWDENGQLDFATVGNR